MATIESREIVERAYLYWIWQHDNPNKFIEESPIWRMVRFPYGFCPLFQLSKGHKRCLSGCIVNAHSICIGWGILKFRQVWTRGTMPITDPNAIDDLFRYSEMMCVYLRSLINALWKDSEVLGNRGINEV